MIILEPEYQDIVKSILSKFIPNYEIRVFGSRINGKVKSYSDLDLVIMCHEEISMGILSDIKNAFSESDLPIKVDIVEFCSLPESIKNQIKNNSIVLQKENS